METTRLYLEKLLQFPHRGLGTKEERKAGELIFNEYKKLGYEPKYFFFKGLWNGLTIGHFINGVYFFLATIFYLLHTPYISLLFFIIGIISAFFLTYKDNSIYKKIFPIPSQSIYAEKRSQSKLTLVIIGHYDTAKKTLMIKYMNKIFDLLVSRKIKRGNKTIRSGLPDFFQLHCYLLTF